jgi:uncharacterized membrane protein YagU involved in acid resistance
MDKPSNASYSPNKRHRNAMMKTAKTLLNGVVAGFVATCVLSALMATRDWLPPLDTITVMDGIARDMALAFGLPTPYAGWLWHFLVGCLIWGWMYAVMESILPGSRPWRKGLYFGFTVTLLVWLIVMPLAGAGMFGMQLSAEQPFVSLLQHLVYGVVLAVAYHRLAYSSGRGQG